MTKCKLITKVSPAFVQINDLGLSRCWEIKHCSNNLNAEHKCPVNTHSGLMMAQNHVLASYRCNWFLARFTYHIHTLTKRIYFYCVLSSSWNRITNPLTIVWCQKKKLYSLSSLLASNTNTPQNPICRFNPRGWEHILNFIGMCVGLRVLIESINWKLSQITSIFRRIDGNDGEYTKNTPLPPTKKHTISPISPIRNPI